MGSSYSDKEVKALIAEAIAPLLARIAEQDRRIGELRQRVVELETENAALKTEITRLQKNSSNSSKPPSSDIVKPPKPPGPQGGKRHIGGQPGHARHLREPFPAAQIDRVETHTLSACPDCGGRVRPAGVSPRVVQQAEWVLRPVEIVEHQAGGYRCARCGKIHYAALPAAVAQDGLLGPTLTALVGYLKGVCHASFSTIRKFCRDVLQFRVSRGQLVKVVHKAAAALAGAYEQLRALLPDEAYLNVDETGHKEKGQRWWTWCFRAQLYTLFKIDRSRGSEVLIDMLGREFAGVLGCDYFSAYHKFMGDGDVAVQFCLAHLIRDVKFLTALPDPVTAAYGQRDLHATRAQRV